MKSVLILVIVEIFSFVMSKDVFFYKRCNDEYCMYSDGKKRTQIEAINQCYQNQKFLLEVPDLSTGRLLDEFVKHYLNNEDDVFLNLQRIKSTWHWTDGNEYDNVISVKDDSEENNFAFLKIDYFDNLHVTAANIRVYLNGWICSRRGQCPSPSITIGSECYFTRSIVSNNIYVWIPFYQAMQDCTLVDATLAIFNKIDEKLIVEKMKMILDKNKEYWFGLTNYVWTWSDSRKVMSYNLLYYNISYTNCPVTYYNHEKGFSEWFFISCSKQVQSVCMEQLSKSSSVQVTAKSSRSTSSKTSRSSSSKTSKSTSSKTSRSTSSQTLFLNVTESINSFIPEGNNTPEELNIPLIIGWILAALFLIAFIIVLITLGVKMRNKKRERKPISRTNTVFPRESNNLPRRPQNLSPDKSSDKMVYIRSTDNYETPLPISENNNYTELHA